MNLQPVIKVRGKVCRIIEDYDTQKLIDYNGQSCLLHTDRDGVVVLRDYKTGKYIGLNAELTRRC